MPTTHTWKGAGGLDISNVYIYDSTQYTDGQPFASGDTLVVSSGAPEVDSTTGNVVNLRAGNYFFNIPAGNTGLHTDYVGLDAASTLSVSGPGQFGWSLVDQFVNGGTMQFGSPAASGSAFVDMSRGASNGVTLTNNGSITIQNNSKVTLQPQTGISRSFVNAAGATLNVKSGSSLTYSDALAIVTTSTPSNTISNGLITVTGSVGKKTSINMAGQLQGSGLLSVCGAPGDRAGDTLAYISGAASGTFDIASGELDLSVPPVSGAINFLDNNGALYDDNNGGLYTSNSPYGATINGFQAGDQIDVLDSATAAAFASASSYSLSWNPSTNLLTLLRNSTPIGQFTLAGSYQASDFHLTVPSTTIDNPLVITTTSTANAITPFAVQDVTTGAVASSPGQQYTGPVNYLQSQYTWTSADKVNVATGLPDVYLVGGAGDDALAASAGSNVLDGGLGSNFLTGATGKDGGTDTFFLDGSKGTTWDTIANFHPGDSVTLWGFVPGTSSDTWAASNGTGSYKGATIHAAFAGTGTPVNGSVTFAGISQATQQADFTVSSGNSGGRDYLNIHYNR